MNQTLRIIGGKYRGKKIHFPDIEGLRPTPDRVRETLFNWLMNDIQDARCLDAFAGSGALGLEAASRGASEVVFIEHNTNICRYLKNIFKTFEGANLKAVCGDVLPYLASHLNPFNIIFLDPPYALNLINPLLKIIDDTNTLKSDGLIYIESATPFEIDINKWQLIKEKKAGLVYFGLLTKK